MADVANEPSMHLSGSIAQSNQTNAIRATSAQLLNSHPLDLNTHEVEANIDLTDNRLETGNIVNKSAPLETHSRTATPSIYTSIITNRLWYASTIPNTARQLSLPTMHFDGLQLVDQLADRSSMRGQLKLLSRSRSPPLNALANVPLALKQPQAQLSARSAPSPVLNSIATQLALIPPAFRFARAPPPTALPLNVKNNVPMAPLFNPHVPTSLCSSAHVQAAAAWSQTHVTSEFMQPNPFSFATGTAPTFVFPIAAPTYGATVWDPLCWGGSPHPTLSARLKFSQYKGVPCTGMNNLDKLKAP